MLKMQGKITRRWRVGVVSGCPPCACGAERKQMRGIRGLVCFHPQDLGKPVK